MDQGGINRFLGDQPLVLVLMCLKQLRIWLVLINSSSRMNQIVFVPSTRSLATIKGSVELHLIDMTIWYVSEQTTLYSSALSYVWKAIITNDNLNTEGATEGDIWIYSYWC